MPPSIRIIHAFLFALLALPLQADSKPRRVLPGGWVYTWGDEFTGKELNQKKWSFELGVVRTRGTSHTCTTEAVSLKGGRLIITTRAEETPNAAYKQGSNKWQEQIRTQPYSSASISTKGKMSFKPGCRLEVRAKIPVAKGSWPAIWMLHENGMAWSACGETDIMEHISQEAGTSYGVFHWGKEWAPTSVSKSGHVKVERISRAWHVYSLEWTEQEMILRVDDREVSRLDIDSVTNPDGLTPIRTPAYLIINTAVGGEGTWPEAPDASQYPCHFEIDYVRYYRKTGAPPRKTHKKKTK